VVGVFLFCFWGRTGYYFYSFIQKATSSGFYYAWPFAAVGGAAVCGGGGRGLVNGQQPQKVISEHKRISWTAIMPNVEHNATAIFITAHDMANGHVCATLSRPLTRPPKINAKF